MREVSFSLITFAFNEEALLERQIRNWIRVLRSFGLDHEIILVNDGSTDRTHSICDALAREFSQLKVIHHPRNLGIGAAIHSAREHVSKNFVFWNDIDSHFDINDLSKILPFLQGGDADIVVGLKHSSFVKVPYLFSWIKSCVNYYLIKALFLSEIRDFQFVQFLPASFFCQDIELRSRSSFIPAECLIKAKRLGLKIYQLELKYHVHNYEVRPSKTNSIKTILNSIVDIFSFWYYWNFQGGGRKSLFHAKKEFSGNHYG